jgi:hypothetical protein
LAGVWLPLPLGAPVAAGPTIWSGTTLSKRCNMQPRRH